MRRGLILDISRILARSRYPSPTGIDRVELAYAEHMVASEADRAVFGAVHPLGRFGLLPTRTAHQFIRRTARRWREGGAGWPGVREAAGRLRDAILLGPGRRPSQLQRPVYLNVSHHHLERASALRTALSSPRSALVCMVHDVIPISMPEYFRPGVEARHRRRVDALARHANGILTNSTATCAAMLPLLQAAGRAPPILVAPLGVALASAPGAQASARATFVCLGTIEPRKNHLLLLQIWRRLANRLGPAAPRLILIGRRGWENEMVVDLLERCRSLQGLVEERGSLPDSAMGAALRGATALLMPSFAEGYGLPVAEALAQGVPAICSDLPALREVGGAVPDYIDPLDGTGWLQAVTEYAEPGSERRREQCARMAGWRPPSWPDHFSSVMDFIDNGVA